MRGIYSSVTRGGTQHNLRVQLLATGMKQQNELTLLSSQPINETQPALRSPCNYTQPVECCPGECGRRVTGELMKCQGGGREIACITYPQGALVVFSRISHTSGVQPCQSHAERDVL